MKCHVCRELICGYVLIIKLTLLVLQKEKTHNPLYWVLWNFSIQYWHLTRIQTRGEKISDYYYSEYYCTSTATTIRILGWCNHQSSTEFITHTKSLRRNFRHNICNVLTLTQSKSALLPASNWSSLCVYPCLISWILNQMVWFMSVLTKIGSPKTWNVFHFLSWLQIISLTSLSLIYTYTHTHKPTISKMYCN